jgi:hypothetical protein
MTAQDAKRIELYEQSRRDTLHYWLWVLWHNYASRERKEPPAGVVLTLTLAPVGQGTYCRVLRELRYLFLREPSVITLTGKHFGTHNGSSFYRDQMVQAATELAYRTNTSETLTYSFMLERERYEKKRREMPARHLPREKRAEESTTNLFSPG